MRAYARLNTWPAKSCPYKTEISPAYHAPNTWIATSDASHYLIP